MTTIWNTLFYQPIYNALIFTINNITFGDVGFAIIIITILVKVILYPLSEKSIKTQILLKRMEPEMKAIKKDFQNKEEQARKTFELYKRYGTNPFSGLLVVLLQLPIIFALYYVFYKGLPLGTGPLYSFVEAPLVLKENFLGFLNLHGKSLILALGAGITQFIQGYLASPLKAKKEVALNGVKEVKTFQEEFAESMQINIKYILPIFIAFIAYKISAAVALYWVVNNICTILQEWYIRRKFTTV